MNNHIINKNLFQQSCLLGNGWINIDDFEKIAVNNPATGDIVGYIPNLGYRECELAIVASQKAQAQWAEMPAAQRSKILRRWFFLIHENREDLAKIMTIEQGKPLAEARIEMDYAASFIEWFSEEGKRMDGEILQSPKPDLQLQVIKQPVGVCAAITPWNFPAAMITRKAAPALAAGCSLVLKPAEETPFSAMALGVLALEAGVPLGVLQIITGNAKEIGLALTKNPIVRKLTFTGSTQTGRVLMEQCSSTIKKISLELGGNAPLIVFEDADVELAVKGIVAAKFRNMGQTCVCANRIYVHHAIYEQVVDRLIQTIGDFKIGNGLDEANTHGPLINKKAVDKAHAHVVDAIAKGAQLKTGGKQPGIGDNYYLPTVLTEATDDMLICHEETFGPIAALFRFSDEADVVRRANHTEFGLAAYVFTNDYRRIHRLSKTIECGMLGINTGAISNEVAPFGGIKQSGLGREGSRHGIDEYLEKKYLCIDTQ